MTESDPDWERHVTPNDSPRMPHAIDTRCWCQPECVHQDENGSVWRHRRMN